MVIKRHVESIKYVYINGSPGGTLFFIYHLLLITLLITYYLSLVTYHLSFIIYYVSFRILMPQMTILSTVAYFWHGIARDSHHEKYPDNSNLLKINLNNLKSLENIIAILNIIIYK